MAQIPRPPKQGNVMTYVAKVAAGYPHILAGEVDADLDTIYGAWNGGADTVNIRDGAITSAKLAADAVGPRELQDSGVGTSNLADAAVTTPKIVDGAVTDPKIVSVAWAKVTGTPAAFVGAAAGGDLSGTYPNPAIRDGAVTAAKLAPNAVTGSAIGVGQVGSPQIQDGCIGTVELVDGAVTRAKLAVNASNGSGVSTLAPTGFSLSAAGVWTTYATLPSLTTRGGAVLLYANAAMCVNGQITSQVCLVRWLRDGVQIATTSLLATALSIPFPGLHWVDAGAAAGAHVYTYQAWAGSNCVVLSSPQAEGGFLAMEIG